MVSNDTSRDERHLNPFAFPAETNIRFSLLIFALIMLSIDLFELVVENLWGDESGLFDLSKVIAAPSSSTDPDVFRAETLSALVSSLEQAGLMALVLTVAIGVVLIAASIAYRTHPARLRRRQHLTEFPPGKDARFTGEVASLAALAGVDPVPVIEVGAKSPPADGQVFGVGGHYFMRLGSMMPLVLRKAPAAFRATVLHELAHIANGDIWRAYFSQSLWTVLLVALVLPVLLIFTLLFGQRIVSEFAALVSGEGGRLNTLLIIGIPTFIWVVFQTVGLVALFAALRGSLLRAREVYADWRAAIWGADEGLVAIFRGNSDARPPSFWSRLWRLHPDPRTRLTLINNPRALFGLSGDVPFLVGCLVGASTTGFLSLTILAAGAAMSALYLLFVAALTGGPVAQSFAPLISLTLDVTVPALVITPYLVLAYLIAASVGLQAQRDGLAALASTEKRGLIPYLRLVIPAGLLILGMQAGFLITPLPIFAPILNLLTYEGSLVSLLAIPFKGIALVIGMTAAVWVALAWTRFAARRLMSRKTGPKPPHGRRRFLTLWLTVMLWVIIVPSLILQFGVWSEVLTTGLGLPLEGFIAAALIGLVLLGALLVFGVGIVSLGGLGQLKCPSCGKISGHRYAVGQTCSSCGAELAEWLIVRT